MYIKAASRARSDRNQSTTDRRFYSYCAAINDDSAKRNKTSLRYLLRIGTASIRRCAIGGNFSNSASTANRPVAVLYDRFSRCSRLSFRLAHADIYARRLCPLYGPGISPHKFSQSQSSSEKLAPRVHFARATVHSHFGGLDIFGSF